MDFEKRQELLVTEKDRLRWGMSGALEEKGGFCLLEWKPVGKGRWFQAVRDTDFKGEKRGAGRNRLYCRGVNVDCVGNDESEFLFPTVGIE